MIENKYTIAAILEMDGTTPKQSHQYRVGKTGIMDRLRIGSRMCFKYEDGHGMLISSPILHFIEDDCGYLISTENSIYRMNGCKEQVNNICDETRVMDSINIL